MFNVGDEVVCVDDSIDRCGSLDVKRGEKFVVLAVLAPGEHFGPDVLNSFAISIGRKWNAFEYYAEVCGKTYPHFDLWQASRFRKVERKRSREELYSLIGINGMVEQREGVAA